MQYGVLGQFPHPLLAKIRPDGFRTWALALYLCMIATTSQADTLSIVDGHAYHGAQFSELTVDIAGRAQSDVSRGGLKLTLPRKLDHLVVYIEGWGTSGQRDGLAIESDVDFSGNGSGIGLYYTGLPDWKAMSTTLRLAYNQEENTVDSLLSIAGRQAIVERDLRNISARVLFSPLEPLHESGLGGYAAFGLSTHRLRQQVLVDQQPEPFFGVQESTVEGYLALGIVYPLNRFSFYAAAEYQQAFSLSAGVRWQVSKTPPQVAWQ